MITEEIVSSIFGIKLLLDIGILSDEMYKRTYQ